MALQAQVPVRKARSGDHVSAFASRDTETAEGVEEDRRLLEGGYVEPVIGVALSGGQLRIHDEVRAVSTVGLGAAERGGQDRRERLAGLERQDSGGLPLAKRLRRSTGPQPALAGPQG